MTFAGYEVLGRVAAGSTGVVWQARQVELDRVVAIKELSPVLLSAPGFLQRFRAEAQTLAVLDDPHVVRIYDYVEEPARAYLVQEWVDGAPLAAVLQQHGALTPEQSLGVLRGGLIGLAHAHNRGLVHRDISPANILLDRGGTSRLVDFGLAARTDQGIAPGAATSVGTPAFASPEAITGAPMTTRSDVYSAAAVLFLLLSGRLPYPGDVGHVLQGHTSAPVPHLDSHGPDLANLLVRGMAKDPDQRPADAAAFLAELEQAATQRYGAGWLNRASVAGLVGAGTTAAGAGAAVLSTGATSSAVPATTAATTAQAVTYGATSAPTSLPAQLPATAARTGARLLGLPQPALLIGAAAAIIAMAVAAVLLFRPTLADPLAAAADNARSAAQEVAGGEPGTGSEPAEPEPEPVAAFSGTYTVTTTLTAKTGDVAGWPEVGTAETDTWVVTGTCSVGLCDASVSSGADGDFTLTFSGGGWTQDTSFVAECVDTVTGVPTGSTVNVAGSRTLTAPAGDLSADGGTLASVTGTETLSTPAPGCGSGGLEISYSIALTRTGD